MATILVCPNCNNGDRLLSVETAALGYPVRFGSDGSEVEYVGAYTVYDEGTSFENVIVCRNCFGYTELKVEDLIPVEVDK